MGVVKLTESDIREKRLERLKKRVLYSLPPKVNDSWEEGLVLGREIVMLLGSEVIDSKDGVYLSQFKQKEYPNVKPETFNKYIALFKDSFFIFHSSKITAGPAFDKDDFSFEDKRRDEIRRMLGTKTLELRE